MFKTSYMIFLKYSLWNLVTFEFASLTSHNDNDNDEDVDIS